MIKASQLDAPKNILSMAEKYKYMWQTFRKRLAFGKWQFLFHNVTIDTRHLYHLGFLKCVSVFFCFVLLSNFVHIFLFSIAYSKKAYLLARKAALSCINCKQRCWPWKIVQSICNYHHDKCFRHLKKATFLTRPSKVGDNCNWLDVANSVL